MNTVKIKQKYSIIDCYYKNEFLCTIENPLELDNLRVEILKQHLNPLDFLLKYNDKSITIDNSFEFSEYPEEYMPNICDYIINHSLLIRTPSDYNVQHLFNGLAILVKNEEFNDSKVQYNSGTYSVNNKMLFRFYPDYGKYTLLGSFSQLPNDFFTQYVETFNEGYKDYTYPNKYPLDNPKDSFLTLLDSLNVKHEEKDFLIFKIHIYETEL